MRKNNNISVYSPITLTNKIGCFTGFEHTCTGITRETVAVVLPQKYLAPHKLDGTARVRANDKRCYVIVGQRFCCG